MTKELLAQIANDIDKEQVRFGSVTVKFIFHDGRITCYESTTTRRRNVIAVAKSADQKGGTHAKAN